MQFITALCFFVAPLRAAPADHSFTGSWDTSLGTMPAGKIGAFNYNITASVTTAGTVTVSIVAKSRTNCTLFWQSSGGAFSGTAGDKVGMQVGSGVNIRFDAEL